MSFIFIFCFLYIYWHILIYLICNEPGPVTNRKAFRLCIATEDRARLLDESRWPDSIVISEWYYLNPANRVQSQVKPSGNTAGAAAESMDINNHNVTSDDAVEGDQNAAEQYADISRITTDDANDNTV